jgi:hypothetical protein
MLPARDTNTAFKGVGNEHLDAQSTEKELLDALRKAKTNKASGPDGIPAEFFKNLLEDGTQAMLRILNQIWNDEVYPDDRSTSITLMIFKKKRKIRCKRL